MAMHAKATRILDQLDFALALILRNHIWRIQHRGAVTKNVELLGLLTSLATGDGVEAARLIRRFQKLNPEDPREPDGSVSPESCPDEFAWDAYQRVEALDDLADEFPDHIRTAARSMHAWPMLMPRHTKQPPPVSTACQAVRFGRVLSDRCERRRTVPARHAAGAVSGSNV
jgi:hypothetical protein